MSRFEDSYASLQTEFAEIQKELEFVQQSFRIFGRTGQLLPHLIHLPELRQLLLDWRQTNLIQINFIYQAFLVQAWAVFELFIRRLVVSYLEEFAERKADFKTLDKYGLIKRNILHTGVAFQQIFDNRTNAAVDFYSFAKNVSTSVPEAEVVQLNAKAFTFFLKSPTFEGIRDAFRRIGISEFDWKKIAAESTVQKALGTKRTSDTTKAIDDFLDITAKARNNIVHRGEGMTPVSEAEVRQIILALDVISSALMKALLSDCETKCR
jgi:hypothetical protein